LGVEALDDLAHRPETEWADRVARACGGRAGVAGGAALAVAGERSQPARAQLRSRFRHGAVVDEFERDDALFVQVDDLDAVAGVGEALAPQLLEQRRAVPGEQAEELG